MLGMFGLTAVIFWCFVMVFLLISPTSWYNRGVELIVKFQGL